MTLKEAVDNLDALVVFGEGSASASRGVLRNIVAPAHAYVEFAHGIQVTTRLVDIEFCLPGTSALEAEWLKANGIGVSS